MSDCYVIAEIGVNHNGSIETARELIDVAAAAGANAAKFQSFSADELVSATAKKAAYQTRNTGVDGPQHEMLRALELSEADTAALMRHCGDRGVGFLSTPFGFAQAAMLDRLGVTAYKVSSGDLTYLDFLADLASRGRPMIVSTGMATLAEVEAAVDVIARAGDPPVSLLHCVSDYPAAPEACNLRAMETMRRAFGLPVGWSDHTTGFEVGIAAVALGATVIEKHITLDQAMDGPDHAASMEPDDFVRYVTALRNVEVALGDGAKRPQPSEVATAEVARRSVVAVRAIEAGQMIRSDDVAVLRPGTGLPPNMLDFVVGLRAVRAIAPGVPVTKAALRE